MISHNSGWILRLPNLWGIISKLEKAVAVSGVCLGVLQESSGKVPGKLLEKMFAELRNATNSRISGTGKGRPAGNLRSTLP